MAISFVGSNGNTAASVTMPAHQVGDLLLIFAYSSTASIPSQPSGWTTILSNNTSNYRHRVGYKFATSTSETSGTWTNSVRTIVMVYRGVSSIGSSAENFSNDVDVTYPGLTLTNPGGLSWVVRFAGFRTTRAAFGALPGYVLRRSLFVDRDATSAGYDSASGVSSNPASAIQSASGTSANWVAITLELVPIGNPVATLVDEFATADSSKWLGYGADITVSGGAARFNETGGELASVGRYSLMGSGFHVRVNTDFIAGITFGAGSPIQMVAQAGDDISAVVNGNTLYNTAYNPVAHRWWRMRETSGTLYWEVSPDGLTWTTLYSGGSAAADAIYNLKHGPVSLVGLSSQFSSFNGTPPVGPKIKAYVGGSWMQGVPKRHNGTSWVPAKVKRHDGSAWV